MRVGIVCPYSLSLPGGVQAQVLGLARELRSLGHHARVLGPCDGPPPDAHVTPLGNSLPTAANGSIAPVAPDPAAALRTIRALRDEEFDVVHLHEPLAPGPTVTSLMLKPAPLIGTFHAAGGSLAYDMMSGVLRRLARRLDRRAAVSEDARAMARRSLGGEYEVLFNGVEVERIQSVAAVPAGRPTVLFLGRHEPRKGLAVLLEALAELPRDVVLWIAGEGPETEALRAKYAGDTRIEWLGRISDDEKFARLRSATAFCAPSLHGESFGIVLIEAMAAGTPVVASDLAGYAAVADGGRCARLVPPGDAAALAGALRAVLASGHDELTAAGYERAEHFSMVRLARLYLGLYGEILS